MAESDWNRFVLRNSWSIKAILESVGDLHVFFLKHMVFYMGGETVKGPGEGGSKRGTACTWRFNKHDHECHPTNWFVAADTASSYNLRSFFTEELKRKQNMYTYFPVYSKCFMFSIYWTAPKISHQQRQFSPLNPELNPICYLLALLGARHFLHVSRIRVKLLTLRRIMSYIYGAPILDVSRSHTTTQHSR